MAQYTQRTQPVHRCAAWIKAVGRSDLANKSCKVLHTSYRICDIHFPQSDRCSKKLKNNAVPTLVLPQIQNDDDLTKCTQTDILKTRDAGFQTVALFYIDSQTQTPQDLSRSLQRKRKLQESIDCKRNRQRFLENQVEIASSSNTSLSPEIEKIVNLKKKNQLHQRCDKDFKLYALTLYCSSPVSYSILHKTFSLPSPQVLRKIKFHISTKLTSDIIRCLESKFKTLKDTDKYCIICADEISLKKNLYYDIRNDKIIGFHEVDDTQSGQIATRAFVLMSRGLFSDWEQPLGYCFLSTGKSNSKLKLWLDEVVAKVFEIGFNVIAFTSDQGSNFLKIAKDRNVSVDQPFFHISGKKVHYIFDIQNLIKSVRNDLLKYDFKFKDFDSQFVASWEDIKKLYETEKVKSYRLAPKLTDSHVTPNNVDKMKVKYTTQVLSNTVAAAIHAYVEFEKLPLKSMGTVKFVQLMNDMFDILNSTTVQDECKFRNAFSEKDFQIDTLQRVLNILSEFRVLDKENGKDVTNTIQFIEGLQISIKSILNISSDLKEMGFYSFFTQRLNKDCLKKMFDTIKQQGNFRKPTPLKFKAAFKKLFIDSMLRHSDNANLDDLDELLLKADDFENPENVEPTGNPIQVGTVDYRFDIPDENGFIYVCAYLLHKCHHIHEDCCHMNEYIKVEGTQTCDRNSSGVGSLIVPPVAFIRFVEAMDQKFKYFFSNNNLRCHVGHEILSMLKEDTFKMPCKCFPIDYLKKLFVRFRIFTTIRYNNGKIKDKSFGMKYFSINNL